MVTDKAKTKLSIQDMPQQERPRERLLQQGASTLSNAELLAVVLRVGTADENVLHLAERILAEAGGLQGLGQVLPTTLEHIPGVGPAKSAQILAVMELAKRYITQIPPEGMTINSAEDAARLVLDMSYLPQEHVRIILLDNARHVLSIPTVYIGTIHASVMRVAELFREAIVRNCPAIIMVHNHPSGAATPSPEDIEITRTIVAAGRLLDIQVLDHLIIAPGSWVSLKNLKLGFA